MTNSAIHNSKYCYDLIKIWMGEIMKKRVLLACVFSLLVTTGLLLVKNPLTEAFSEGLGQVSIISLNDETSSIESDESIKSESQKEKADGTSDLEADKESEDRDTDTDKVGDGADKEEILSPKRAHLELEEQKRNKMIDERTQFESMNEYSQEKHGEPMDRDGNHNIPILIFHEIRKDYKGDVGVIISDKTFEEYMLYLKVLGYQAITFDDYSKFLAGEKVIAKNSVIVTFDDGYFSNYEIAYPIMKKLGIKGTVAVIGSKLDLEFNTYRHSVDNERLKFLSWKNAREMEDSGVFRIEGHTYNLHELGDDVKTPRGVMPLKEEPIEATEGRLAGDEIMFQQKMQNCIGRNAEVFVYPFGLREDITDQFYNRMGYKYTLGTEHGISNLKVEKNSIKRLNTPVSKTPIRVLTNMLKLEGKPEVLPYSDVIDQAQRIELLRQMAGV